MQAIDMVPNGTMDTVVQVLSWLLMIFSALWLITGILGFMHRRAYNLTRAESGGSSPITPDFLKIDQKKRQAAIDRGAAYDEVLEARAAAAGPSAAVAKTGFWSRAAATVTAFFTLSGAVIGTLQKVDSLESGASELGSWDKIVAIVKDHPIGTVIAIIVIGANVIIFVKATKKTPAKA